jgi:hypothetical protein
MSTRRRLIAPLAVAAAAAGCVGSATALAAPPTRAELQDGFKSALAYLAATQITAPDRLQDGVRLEGEWPSYVRGNIIDDDRVSAIYDSNAFVPMFVTYPLLALDDASLPAGAQRIKAMKRRVLPLLERWYVKPDGRANFWPTVGGFHGPAQIYETLPQSRALAPIFDIADDADDTAVARVTMLSVLAEFPTWADELHIPTARDTGLLFSARRDTDRVRSDPREEGWKPRDTGAFMTWLDDEERPGNRLPIAFALANNVDCTVTANALYAQGLGERLAGTVKDVAGYQDSCALLRQVILARQFPACGLYYPAEWLFPYAVSRAFADGGADCLAQPDASGALALEALVSDILGHQLHDGDLDGAWADTGKYADLPADVDAAEAQFRGTAHAYSTALNIVTLYNLGVQNRPDARTAIDRGLRWLVDHAVVEDGQRFWQGGVFFSSSVKDLARWKSRPYTTAVVLEALTRALRDPANGGAGLAGRWTLTPADVPADWL